MAVFRKLRELTRNPHRFFYDLLAKRVQPKQQGRRQLQRLSETADYTVVTAVYRAEAYLPKYFEAFVQQSIGFEQRVELILVLEHVALELGLLALQLLDHSVALVIRGLATCDRAPWRLRWPSNRLHQRDRNPSANGVRARAFRRCYSGRLRRELGRATPGA